MGETVGQTRPVEMDEALAMMELPATLPEYTTDDLRREVAGGLLYTHHRANANTSRILEVASFAYAVIELLKEKGLITEEELNERKRAVGRRLVEHYLGKNMGVMLQDGDQDKYRFQTDAKIDCENRIHLCRAACCKLQFALSRQDIHEGVVKWDLEHPYMNAQGKDGYCVHLERGACRCSIYAHRPIPCRAYDCRNDARIWADFEQYIPSPGLERLLAQLPGRSAPQSSGAPDSTEATQPPPQEDRDADLACSPAAVACRSDGESPGP